MPYIPRFRTCPLVTAVVLLAFCTVPSHAQSGPTPDAIVNAYTFNAAQITATASTTVDTLYPQYTFNDSTNPTGMWHYEPNTGWSGGFWVGAMWQQYRQTGNPQWAELARRWQNATGPDDMTHLQSRDLDTSTHDVGFVLFNSFGNALRYGTDDDKTLAKTVLVQGAASLDTRFRPSIGQTESRILPSAVLPVHHSLLHAVQYETDAGTSTTDPHADQYRVIIDNMMNLELLFWGAELTTDPNQKQTWYDHAVSHAQKTILSHFGPDTDPRWPRPDDGSTYQRVYFNMDGTVNTKDTSQGYSATSCWSRGQAWAIYGYTMCARYARRHGDTANAATFTAQAQKAADYYLAHLPADGIAFWDFNDPAIPNAPRDASSAAVASAGLFELSTYITDGAAQARDLNAARHILVSLVSPAYLAQGSSPAVQATLLHGSFNVPKKLEDQGLIWADYYLLEALQRNDSLLSPTADTYVRNGSYANASFGKANLFVKHSTSGTDERWTYLTFDTHGVKGSVNNARLRLYGANQNAAYSGAASVYAVSATGWSETGITWNTKPNAGADLASAPVTFTPQYTEWDITAYVQAQRTAGRDKISLAVKMNAAVSPGDAYDKFSPREAAQNGPQLAIQTY